MIRPSLTPNLLRDIAQLWSFRKFVCDNDPKED
jgi:hypothetical protein